MSHLDGAYIKNNYQCFYCKGKTPGATRYWLGADLCLNIQLFWFQSRSLKHKATHTPQSQTSHLLMSQGNETLDISLNSPHQNTASRANGHCLTLKVKGPFRSHQPMCLYPKVLHHLMRYIKNKLKKWRKVQWKSRNTWNCFPIHIFPIFPTETWCFEITEININMSRLQVVLGEGHSHSKEHQIGQSCEVKDESSIFLKKNVHNSLAY